MLWSLSESNMGSTLMVLFFIYIIKQMCKNIKQRRRLPPGPMGLPIVGYVPFLGKDPHKDIAKLGNKYGNVFTLQMGIHNVIILNDWEAVRDALFKDSFLGRPDCSPIYIATGQKSLVDENGLTWREHRRLASHLLRELSFGSGHMVDRITDEIAYLMRDLDRANGSAFNVHTLLTPSLSNVISLFVFGHRFDYNDFLRPSLDQALDSARNLFSQFGILALSPNWVGRALVKLETVFTSNPIIPVYKLFQEEIARHIKIMKENVVIKDYIDGYLVEMETRKNKKINTTLTLKMLSDNCLAFFDAGSDTVRTTIEWNLLLCAAYPNYQDIIQQEIDSVVGCDRSPSWNDRLRMPFTQAFMCETFRWKPVLPLSLMRRAVEDSSILGRFIPKDTWVLVNIWAVHNDPKVWDSPNQFNPFRFLSDDGKYVIRHESLIPFSTGKRSCAGETLARVSVFLYLASLLQRYRISAAENTIITFDERFGLTLQPKDRVILRFQARSINKSDCVPFHAFE